MNANDVLPTPADCKRALVGITRLLEAVQGLKRQFDGIQKAVMEKSECCHTTDSLTNLRRLRNLEELREADSRLSSDRATLLTWVSFP